MSKTVEIMDFSSPALDVYARLTENQLVSRADPANAMFIAESPLVIGRALDAGYEPVSVLMEARHGNGAGAEILARLGADVPVFTAPDSVLVNLTGFHLTRGMLCCMRRRALPPAEALCRDARRVAVLENVMNPTNIGAIFRGSARHGRRAAHRGRERPLVPPRCAREHGHGLSGAVDVSPGGGTLAGYAARARL